MVGSVAAADMHKAWYEAIDEALRVADTMSRERPNNLGDLLIQYEVVWCRGG